MFKNVSPSKRFHYKRVTIDNYYLLKSAFFIITVRVSFLFPDIK